MTGVHVIRGSYYRFQGPLIGSFLPGDSPGGCHTTACLAFDHSLDEVARIHLEFTIGG